MEFYIRAAATASSEHIVIRNCNICITKCGSSFSHHGTAPRHLISPHPYSSKLMSTTPIGSFPLHAHTHTLTHTECPLNAHIGIEYIVYSLLFDKK